MNVLATGVGAIIGQGILKSLRSGGFQGQIHGMDIYPHAYGQRLCDKFHVAPRADAPDYVERLNTIVLQNRIDLIIPGIEQDLYRLHQEKAKITSKVVMNNDLLISLSKDKWATFEFFQQHGVSLIPTLSSGDFKEVSSQLGVPFVLKPKFSYASKGLFIVEDEYQFEALRHKKKDALIFQKRISPLEGEFTVHLFGDGKGGVFDILAMRRTLASDGSTGVAEYSDDKKVIEYCLELVRLTHPIGPTNIQLMKDGGIPRLLEINPRISSACSIATLMGYNAPLGAVKFFAQNQTFSPAVKKPVKVVRYTEDWIFAEGKA